MEQVPQKTEEGKTDGSCWGKTIIKRQDYGREGVR